MHTQQILSILQEHYDTYGCGLNFTNPYELLVATVLSAQCTDERVNQVTPALFAAYPTARDMANADVEELEQRIWSVNFHHNKAIHLHRATRMLVEEFAGEVPATMEELTRLPGVGRKTANVVLANCMGVPAIAVDTHVFRVSHRLGLSDGKNPDETEQDLMRVIPQEFWSQAHHWLIWHGRKVCKAQKPSCSTCPRRDICPSGMQGK